MELVAGVKIYLIGVQFIGLKFRQGTFPQAPPTDNNYVHAATETPFAGTGVENRVGAGVGAGGGVMTGAGGTPPACAARTSATYSLIARLTISSTASAKHAPRAAIS